MCGGLHPAGSQHAQRLIFSERPRNVAMQPQIVRQADRILECHVCTLRKVLQHRARGIAE
jgi:hypothetical protein